MLFPFFVVRRAQKNLCFSIFICKLWYEYFLFTMLDWKILVNNFSESDRTWHLSNISLINLLLTAASTAMPGSREHPITLNDAEGQQGESNTVTQAMVQNTMRHMRPAREPRGRQAQEHRPAVHQRNNYGNQRYYENRYHGNHGSNGGGGAGYRYSGSDYERQPYQHNYMHGLPGTYYPGYGHCHLCGKYLWRSLLTCNFCLWIFLRIKSCRKHT